MAERDDDLDLANLDDFSRATAALNSTVRRTSANGLYCATCGGKRRMAIATLHWDPGILGSERIDYSDERNTPGLFRLTCLQCGTAYHALVTAGAEGPELAIHAPVRGGLSTPNAPSNVTYYLDQAHRAESVGATSAATAMYRSALEMLLFQQGYETGMLKRKIDDLLADPNPPGWRDRIDSDYLDAMKDLGNAAIHPNDGDESRQAALDEKLLAELRAIFVELLDEVYERPVREVDRKSALDAARQSF